MSRQPIGYIVRALTASAATVGVGVLLDSKRIVTCAHVVNAALGWAKDRQDQPGRADLVTFEFAVSARRGADQEPTRRFTARVVKWLPPLLRGLSSDDLAGLELVEGQVPAGLVYADFALREPTPGTKVQVFGYPTKPLRANGIWAPSTIAYEVADGLLQLNGAGDLRAQPGFSGGPVVSEAGNHLLGLLAIAEHPNGANSDSYLIPADRIRRFWPELSEANHFEDPGSGPSHRHGGPDFFDQVLDVARARYPQATITEIREDGYFRLTAVLDNEVPGQWPVGVVAGDLTEVLLERFRTRVHEPMARWDRYLRSFLVYGGAPATTELARSALQSGIKVQSLVEFQQLVDLRTLLAQQAQRIDRDPQYATSFYVAQRYRMVESKYDADESLALLDQVARWVQAESPRFIVLLGDFGTGKTFLMRELARKLSDRLPALLVELKDVEKAPDLDTLLSQILNRYKHYDTNLGKLLYMVKHGRAVLLVDGFDELALRVSYDRAANYLKTLIDEASEGATVVLTSRRQHFISDGQVLNAFGGQVSARTGSRIAIIEKFDAVQIREFLVNFHQGAEGAEERAREHFEVLDGITHLLELAANPQMLAFIAAIEVDRLREIQAERGRTTRADIYREVVDSWLEREAARQRHRNGVRSFDRAERQKACAALAVRMWQRSESAVSLADLKAGVVDALPIALEQGYQQDEAAHAIGSGSLLVRTDDEKFAFVHQSVLEYLVAAELAERFSMAGTADSAQLLSAMPLSDLMIEFLCDLSGPELTAWVAQTQHDAAATDTARKNAFAVARRVSKHSDPVVLPPVPADMPPDLSGLDLRNVDLSGPGLKGAQMRGAKLTGMRISGVDFGGADLTEADFRGARLFGGSLAGAELAGSTWHRAALVGVEGVLKSTAVELYQAAIIGRDPAEVMVKGTGPVACLALSPAGDLLAVGRGHAVEIVDLPADMTIRVVPIGGAALAVGFSQDGEQLLTASRDGTARIWDVVTGAEVGDMALHRRGAQAAGFSADGAHLVTASYTGGIRVWQVATGRLLVTLREAPGRVRAVGLSADGSRLVIGESDGTVRILDLDDGTETVVTGQPTGLVRAVGFSADGGQVVIGCEDGTVRIWDLVSGRVSGLSRPTGRLRAVGFSADGRQILTGFSDGAVRVWDAQADQLLGSLAETAGQPGPVAFSADGRRWVTSSADGVVRIWDAAAGGIVASVAGLQSQVVAISFAPDGKHVLIGQYDGTVLIWDPVKGSSTELAQPAGSRPLRAMGFSADGNRFVTGSFDGTLHLRDTATGESVRTVKPPDARVGTVGWSADGERLALADSIGRLHIWDTVTGKLDGIPVKVRGLVKAVGFSADDERLVIGSYDGAVAIWNIVDGVWERTLAGHTGVVRGVAFSRGNQVLTSSDDGTNRIWDALSGRLLATLIVLPDDGCAVLLPDGSYKLAGDPGDTLWWVVKQCRFAPGELDPYVPEITRLPPQAPIFGY